MNKISFITCTYNPNIELLVKVTQSIANQKNESNIDWEYIIVDNNSSPAVELAGEISEIISRYRNFKIVRELKQGLTYARIRGLEESDGQLLIFVDDDCEIDADYLQKVAEISEKYLFLGVMGPGNISVNFIGKIDLQLSKQFLYMFQERHIQKELYSNFPEWNLASPPGSGIVVRRYVMSEYKKQVNLGNYNATDRKGKSLASAGDAQIIFTGIKMGLGSGVFPDLKLIHHIPGFRTQSGYLQRLQFGIGFSYWLVLNEMFPSDQNQKVQNGNIFFFNKTVLYFIRNIKKGYPVLLIDYANELGKWMALLNINKYEIPFLASLYIKYFKLV